MSYSIKMIKFNGIRFRNNSNETSFANIAWWLIFLSDVMMILKIWNSLKLNVIWHRSMVSRIKKYTVYTISCSPLSTNLFICCPVKFTQLSKWAIWNFHDDNINNHYMNFWLVCISSTFNVWESHPGRKTRMSHVFQLKRAFHGQ